MEAAIETRKTKVAKEPVPKGAWLVLLGIWLVTCAAPMNMFKPATIAPELMAALSIPATSYGWVMSVFSIMGLILAMPATGIVYKLGLKKSFIISIATMTLGTLLGALSINYEMLLLSRIIEGCGMGFVAVATPTAISLWFPPSRRALPIGIYQTWMPVGTLLSMNLAPIFATSYGWRGIWWFGVVFCVIAAIVFLVTWKEPPENAFEEKETVGVSGKSSVKKIDALKNPSLWILCIGFAVFALTCTGTTSSFWALYMRTEAGISPQVAALAASLCTVVGVVGTPFGGWVADKLGHLKWCMVFGWAVVLVFLWFAFGTTSVTFLFILAIVNGLFQGWVPVTTTAAIPKVLGDKDLIPMGMGLMNVFRNIGNILGGMALAYFVTPFGWSLGSHILCIPPIILVVVLTLLITRKAFK